MDDRDRSIGFLFSDIARFRGTIFDQLMQPFDLTHAQAYVLNHLFRQDGLTQTELAERMNVGTVTVSGLLDRLEVRGWVKRKTAKNDRRAKQIWLADGAENMRLRMVEQFQVLNDVTLDGFDDAEILQLVELLRRAKSNLSGTLEKSQK